MATFSVETNCYSYNKDVEIKKIETTTVEADSFYVAESGALVFNAINDDGLCDAVYAINSWDRVYKNKN